MLNNFSKKYQKYILYIHPVTLISTLFLIGKIPFAPGTLGSIFSAIIFIICSLDITLLYPFSIESFNNFLHYPFNINEIFNQNYLLKIYFFHIVIIFLIGWYSATIYSKKINKDDPGEIIIDEYVGQYITFFITFAFIKIANYYQLNFIKILVAIEFYQFLLIILINFILFRLFDISKIGLIGHTERYFKGSGFGVMIDDIIAGFYAGVTSIIIIILISVLFS